ncbi:MAG: hypothetical protein M3393_06315 [Actinomycetota bacterium]|nr:hypothetical protein [Actinomycetota bacterium]
MSRVCNTLPWSGEALRHTKPERSSALTSWFEACGVTKARRASSALEQPGASCTPVSTAYCATVMPSGFKRVAIKASSAVCARLSW